MLTLAAAPLSAQRDTRVTAFIDVGVIPMDSDRVVPHQTVVVVGGRITALGPSDAVQIPKGARRIDARGKFLMPGLADMHTHVSRAGPSAIDRVLFTLLANGVTTIRDLEFQSKSTLKGLRPIMWQQVQTDGSKMLRLRREIAAGRRWGPRMYLSSVWDRDSTKSVDANLAAYQAAGYDHIKLYFELDYPTQVAGRADIHPKQRRLDSLLTAAHRLGIPLVGHGAENDFPSTSALGLKSIEHLVAYPLDTPDSTRLPEFIRATVRDSLWNTPTPFLNGAAPGPLERRYILAESRELLGREPDSMWASRLDQWPAPQDSVMAASFRRSDRMIKALQDAGAGLLLGTDLPYLPPGYTVHRTLQAFVRAGLTPYQALATGTRNVAAYFGTLDSTGTVAVGKRADLVLLAGNPLENIRNSSEIAGVMVHGRWLDRAELERRLDRMYGPLLQPAPPGANVYRRRASELLGGTTS